MVGELSNGYHIGYFRDSPKEMPAFVGSNIEEEGCIITPMSDNLFSTLRYMIKNSVTRKLNSCLLYNQSADICKSPKSRPF